MIDSTKNLVQKIILDQNYKNPICIDMTCGKAYDSKFILENLNPKILYAFDIQEESRIFSLETLGNFPDNFKFILDNHKNVDKYVGEKIDLAIYNLGYLPKADKNITTNYVDVIESLKKLISLMKESSTIILTLYPGHPSGLLESEYIEKYLKLLDQKTYSIISYRFLNQKNNPPYVISIQKKS